MFDFGFLSLQTGTVLCIQFDIVAKLSQKDFPFLLLEFDLFSTITF